MIADDLLARLARLETGQVSDVLDEAGMPHHALSSSLLPLAPGAFAGRAAVVRGVAVGEMRNAPPALPTDAIERLVSPGTVVVLDAGGFREGAVMGGFVALSLQRRGAVAVVTDGAVRDVDEIRGLGLPVVAGAVTPINGSRRWRLVEADVPGTLPGQVNAPVRISPGDLVLGDGDGVIVVPKDVAEGIVEDAEELQHIETRIREAMAEGAEKADAFKANPRFAHIRPAVRP
ncbi:RraA family protein [Acuticoccus sp.]|uniref:RraA family protein n=1 Tax=Acuticoccus sp. TaxID=1904378 RepID=UPI003B51649A